MERNGPTVTVDDVLALLQAFTLGARHYVNNPGSSYTIRIPFGITGGVFSSTTIPANAVVTRATFHITTPYLPATGTTMTAGITGNTGLFVAGTTASIAATAGSYVTTTDVPMGATPGQLLFGVTSGAGITAGAGTLAVEYTIPLS